MNLLKGSILFKILALVVAFIAYLFITNEIANSEKNKSTDPSYKLIKLTAKSLAIKVRLGDTAPPGYRVLKDQVRVEPARLIVIGPEALLEEVMTAETSIVDTSESVKSSARKIPLESVAGIHLAGDTYLVDVTVPVEKIPSEAPAPPTPAAS